MNWHDFDLGLVWTAAVGQTLFLVLFLTERWWTHRIGRALMVKSLSLGLILWATVYASYHGPLPLWIGRAMFILVTIGILGQFATFLYERWLERKVSR